MARRELETFEYVQQADKLSGRLIKHVIKLNCAYLVPDLLANVADLKRILAQIEPNQAEMQPNEPISEQPAGAWHWERINGRSVEVPD
jgi:primosomal protein N''